MKLPARRSSLLRACLQIAAPALAVTMAMSTSSLAAIDNGSASDGEFVLVLWDRANEASYTLDLGLTMTTLLIDGQKDEGFQRFWTLDRTTDPRLDKLLTANTPLTDLSWAVLGTDTDGNAFEPGTLRMFFTLEHTVETGTINPIYTRVQQVSNGSFETALGAYQQNLASALNNDVSNPDNTHGVGGSGTFSNHGSSYTAKGQQGYFDAPGVFMSTFIDSSGPSVINAVGNSSWFYFATQGSFDTTEPMVLDEFDNLTHDGFWGLAVDTDGTLALSFTIEGTGLTLAQRSFVQAIGRTEQNRGFALRRLDGVATASFETGSGFSRRLLGSEELAAVSSVPEPGSWALMALGLGLLGTAARRRRA